MDDVKRIALQFNDCINARDINGLARLMADDHAFIDSEGNTVSGKENCLNAWRGFFKAFPDYKNSFTTFINKGDLVTIAGYSTCSDDRLAGPALWTARVRDGKLVEWRVYTDTADNRQRLGIDGE
jgi:ketosteroid isomerase-like protein